MQRKYKEEMEGVHDNASAFMAKVNFLTQAESFISKSYISQLHGNTHEKTKK